MTQVSNPAQVRSTVKIKAVDPTVVRRALSELQMDGLLFEKPPVLLSEKREDANLIAHVIADSMGVLQLFMLLLSKITGVQSVSKVIRPAPA